MDLDLDGWRAAESLVLLHFLPLGNKSQPLRPDYPIIGSSETNGGIACSPTETSVVTNFVSHALLFTGLRAALLIQLHYQLPSHYPIAICNLTTVN